MYSNPYIYINKEIDIIIVIWMDDLIIFGKDMININDFKIQLNEEYEMKDLGEFRYFLDIQSTATESERSFISVNQDTIE